jgi:energy-coupling factor transporter ATP-binding protein EcfA2
MISKVVIRNFRILEKVNVDLQPKRNILVGNNDAGKSTFLQAIHLALTGQIGGRSLLSSPITPDLFNGNAVKAFCDAANAGKKPAAPEIRIDVFLTENDRTAPLRGKNNILLEDACGVSLIIKLKEDFANEYLEHIMTGNIQAVPVEFYYADWRTFSGDPLYARKAPVSSQLIEATQGAGERDINRFILGIVGKELGASQKADLSLAYRD